MLEGGPLPGPGGRGSPGVPLRGQVQFPGTQSDRWDLGNPICCPDCPPTHTHTQLPTSDHGGWRARHCQDPKAARRGEGGGLSRLSKPQRLPCSCFLIWKTELVVALRFCSPSEFLAHPAGCLTGQSSDLAERRDGWLITKRGGKRRKGRDWVPGFGTIQSQVLPTCWSICLPIHPSDVLANARCMGGALRGWA